MVQYQLRYFEIFDLSIPIVERVKGKNNIKFLT